MEQAGDKNRQETSTPTAVRAASGSSMYGGEVARYVPAAYGIVELCQQLTATEEEKATNVCSLRCSSLKSLLSLMQRHQDITIKQTGSDDIPIYRPRRIIAHSL